MPSDVVLVALEIEGFRGFRDPARFEFAASAVLLAGPNGTGKTSFFDSIQWLLLGELQRLVPFRARRDSDHIVNSYHQPQPARVAGTFRNSKSELTAIRRGNWESSTLEVVVAGTAHFGAEAEGALRSFLCRGSDVSMQVLLQNAGILQQDVMRHVLEAHPSERHEYISALLGLGGLEGFQSAAADSAKVLKQRARTAQTELDEASSVTASLEQRARAIADAAVEDSAVEAARLSLRRDLDALHDAAAVVVRSSDSLVSLLAEMRAIRDFLSWLESVRDELSQLDGFSTLAHLNEEQAGSEVLAATAAAALADAEAGVTVAAAAFDLAQARAAELDRLAALAIGLLTEVCPVCEQEIDAELVATRLRLRARDAADLAALEDDRERRRQRVQELRTDLASAEQAIAMADARIRERQRLEQLSESLEQEMGRLTTSSGAVTLRVAGLADAMSRSWSDSRASLSATIDRVEYVQNLERSTRDVATMDRLEAELEASRSVRVRLSSRLQEANQRASEADALARNIAEARTAVTQRRFEAIQPLVEDIYGRLDPHPTFKVLQFDHTMYRAKPTTSAIVRDSVENIDAEPLLVFSSSQANIVALSYFLAVGLAAVERRLPFVMLDDPLQSMDDVNVLGFADLCRYMRRDRQVFLSTHDRRFASLLERKLVSRGDDQLTEIVEFWGWDRSGPTFSQRTLGPLASEEVPFPLVRS